MVSIRSSRAPRSTCGRLPARAVTTAVLSGAVLTGAVLTGAVLTGVLAPGAAEAKVRVLVRPDGSKVIFDDPRPEPPATGSSSSRLRAPSRDVADLIDYYANDRGLHPRLVQAVIQVESSYNERARSHKGAMGLMQLMPDTAKLMRVANPYDPAENIRGGTLYLRHQLDRFSGDLTLALAAYNAGPTAVAQYGDVPPYPETRNYVRKVLSLYRDAGDWARDDQPRPAAARAEPTRPAMEPQPEQRGQKVYLSRGKNNRILFTTAPPRPN